ncbi:nickel chaperone for hydrogenase [Haematococcus lacustris]
MPQLATYGQKVPVSVITGFLGSGKSTLLNYLLSVRGEKNICVVENEFGEVNIDKTLVGEQLAQQEDLVSMENGCVCCSLRKDIVKAFAELEKRSKARGRPMDHILLETTGLADPSPVAFTFFANPWIAARFRLDSIICVVDAKHLLQHLEDSKPENAINEAVQQLAFADLILLNKLDLVSETDKADITLAIQRINNTARIIECQLNDDKQRPDPTHILGTNTFSVQRALMVDPEFLDTDSDTEASQQGPGQPAFGGIVEQPAWPVLATAAVRASPPPATHTAAMASPPSAVAVSAPLQPAELAASEEKAAVAGPSGQGRLEAAGQQGGPAAGEAAAAGGTEDGSGCRAAGGSCQEQSPSLLCKRQLGLLQGFEGLQPDCRQKKPKRRRKKLHDLSDISSVGITSRGQLDEYRFNMFMWDLLAEKAKDIFRCKGVLAVHGYGRKKFVFQGVHETICYGPADQPWAAGEVPLNQIVFIGRGLDRKTLVDGFRTCLWQPLPEDWHQAVDPSTKQTYYWNSSSGERSWERPRAPKGSPPPPHLTTHHATTQQPVGVAPRGQRPASSQQAGHSPSNSSAGGSSCGGGGSVGSPPDGSTNTVRVA